MKIDGSHFVVTVLEIAFAAALLAQQGLLTTTKPYLNVRVLTVHAVAVHLNTPGLRAHARSLEP